MRRHKQGFILVTTLIITSLFIFLATYISYRTTTFTSFAATTVAREKAYMLAAGGIQIGMSMLVNTDEDNQDTQKSNQEKPTVQAKGLLSSILPGLNRWQTFNLKEDIDGLKGQIKVALSSEDGKININKIYDFESHTFVGEGKTEKNWKTALQLLFARLEKTVGGDNLFEEFEQFLKKRKQPLDDLTELVTVKAFNKLKDHLFLTPPEKEHQEQPISLTDLFTVWSGKTTLEPWLFSDSVCAILELQRSKSGDIDKRRESVRQWLRDFKLDTRWSVDWDNLMIPLYGKDYNSLPKGIDASFSAHFDPHFFSVHAVGAYEDTSQHLLAIVERIKTNTQGTVTFEVKIRKLYWL